MSFPTKFRTEIICEARRIATLGATDQQLAKIFGVTVRTWHRWKRKFPELQVALEQGKAIADYIVEETIYDRAVRGDMRAARWWMRFRGREVTPRSRE